MMTDSIPYDEIDLEMRRIIQLMNAREGISTHFCCAGHEGEGEAIGYVMFSVATPEVLVALLALWPRLYFAERQNSLGGEHFRRLQLECMLHESYGLVYIVHWGGYNFTAQREVLAELERALEADAAQTSEVVMR